MAQSRCFAEPGIEAAVLLPSKKHADKYLEIGDLCILAIPQGLQPAGFHLVLAVPSEARIMFAQKNVGQEKGGYHRHALAQLGGSSKESTIWVMYDPIQIIRAGKNVWTSWHSAKPNRVDCWCLKEDGHVDLFQVGVVTHDNGQTFRLIGEYRWKGKLFQDKKCGIVGKPGDPKWGAFDVRRSILDDPDFQKLLNEISLQSWTGKPEELDPPLGPVPSPGLARMQWYSAFAGQTGQGPAVLHDDSPAWVHGTDIQDLPDPDGIKRLERNDLVRYTAIHINWGSKKEGPPKILCVQRVH